MAYYIPWMVILFFALVGAFCLNNLLKAGTPSKYCWLAKLRLALVGFVFTFFLLPAPLPNYPEIYSPAFVVVIFETLFQSDGSPGTSQGVLFFGLAGVVIIASAAVAFGPSIRKKWQ
jgi:hypothetical protein